ncbi:hypothetical protein ALC56_09863 [Trachymyrmex septentrionalis]|uniref:Uncharacterized protein n=1 Tax=Trachymyrmex septentrionalis TaxID=34720 RepID=A0A151JU92_9HYME|nr:hypothetical protein ALC56_09863 [Trachymyrmex septentrionalis]
MLLYIAAIQNLPESLITNIEREMKEKIKNHKFWKNFNITMLVYNSDQSEFSFSNSYSYIIQPIISSDGRLLPLFIVLKEKNFIKCFLDIIIILDLKVKFYMIL